MGYLKFVPQPHRCMPPGAIDAPAAGVGSIWECDWDDNRSEGNHVNIRSCRKRWEVYDVSAVDNSTYTVDVRYKWVEVPVQARV